MRDMPAQTPMLGRPPAPTMLQLTRLFAIQQCVGGSKQLIGRTHITYHTNPSGVCATPCPAHLHPSPRAPVSIANSPGHSQLVGACNCIGTALVRVEWNDLFSTRRCAQQAVRHTLTSHVALCRSGVCFAQAHRGACEWVVIWRGLTTPHLPDSTRTMLPTAILCFTPFAYKQVWGGLAG